MSILNKPATLASVTIIASMCASPQFALADTALKPEAQAVVTSQKTNMDRTSDAMKLSREGYGAMREIHAARLAIFNGQPNLANDNLAKANEDLEAVQRNAVSYFAKQGSGFTPMKTNVDVNHQVETRWIPVDANLVTSEDFLPSEKKTNHIAKANEHFRNGDNTKATEELNLGDIDVSFTRLMMPLDVTVRHVNTATALVKEGKYYEASLALKAAEESLVLDTATFVDSAGKVTN